MTLYCKVDCNLDSNPKIRRAGPLARTIYEFLLRRHRAIDGCGELPIANIEPDYLIDVLMLDRLQKVTKVTDRSLLVTEVSLAVTACCDSSLLALRGDFVEILGWNDNWSREPKSNAERQRIYKEKKRLEKSVTKGNGRNVTGNGSNAREEKKRKEKRESAQAREPLPFEIWEKQEHLRRSLGLIELDPTPDRISKIENLLSLGITEEQCHLVLNQLADECRRDKKKLQWFNGDTNWNKKNFDRTLGAVKVKNLKKNENPQDPSKTESAAVNDFC